MEQINRPQSENSNHLLWLGTGAVLCLLVLTVISVLDMRRDYKRHASFFNRRAAPCPKAVALSPETSICPSCGVTVIPCCSYCGSQVQWDASAGKYYCTACRRYIRVICPDCGMPMQPLYQSSPPNGTQVALPYGPSDALCICPSCQTKIVPTCYYCGDHAQWDSSAGKYYCPICKRNIDVICTNCGIAMQPFYQSTPLNGNQVALPSGIPPGRKGNLLCPGCAYRILNQPGMPAGNVSCPVCGNYMARN